MQIDEIKIAATILTIIQFVFWGKGMFILLTGVIRGGIISLAITD